MLGCMASRAERMPDGSSASRRSASTRFPETLSALNSPSVCTGHAMRTSASQDLKQNSTRACTVTTSQAGPGGPGRVRPALALRSTAASQRAKATPLPHGSLCEAEAQPGLLGGPLTGAFGCWSRTACSVGTSSMRSTQQQTPDMASKVRHRRNAEFPALDLGLVRAPLLELTTSSVSHRKTQKCTEPEA